MQPASLTFRTGLPALALLLATAAPALAHGGTHPNPFPIPGTPPSGPGTPSGTPSTSGTPEPWEAWWFLNQWRYLDPAPRGGLTGAAASAEAARDASEIEMLRRFFQHALTHDADPDPRSSAALALGKTEGLPAREDLEKALDDPEAHRYVRESAALALGMMGAVASAPRLLRVAEDPKAERALRVHAILALGLLREVGAAASLTRILGTSKDAELEMAATLALGCVGDETAAATLVGILAARDTRSAPLRAAAAGVLGKLPDRRVADRSTHARVVAACTADMDAEVRRSAALVLHRIEGAEAIAALRRAADIDSDRLTRGYALLSLGQAAPRLSPIDRDGATALASTTLRTGSIADAGCAALALGLCLRAGPGDPTPLRLGCVSGASASRRSACAIGLGLCRDPEGGALLVKLLSDDGGDPGLRRYCCLALALYGPGDLRAVTALRKILVEGVDPSGRAAAAVALAGMGRREAIADLLPVLADKNMVVRLAVILSLGAFRDPSIASRLLAVYWEEKNAQTRAITVAALGCCADRHRPPILHALAADFDPFLAIGRHPAIEGVLRLF